MPNGTILFWFAKTVGFERYFSKCKNNAEIVSYNLKIK